MVDINSMHGSRVRGVHSGGNIRLVGGGQMDSAEGGSNRLFKGGRKAMSMYDKIVNASSVFTIVFGTLYFFLFGAVTEYQESMLIEKKAEQRATELFLMSASLEQLVNFNVKEREL